MVLDTELNSRQRDYLEKIQVSGRMLLELVDDVLDYSHLETGKLHLDSAPIDIVNMIDTVVSLYADKVSAKNLKLNVDIDQRMELSLIGDAMRLKQMLFSRCRHTPT